jgi:hypothetical protein
VGKGLQADGFKKLGAINTRLNVHQSAACGIFGKLTVKQSGQITLKGLT